MFTPDVLYMLGNVSSLVNVEWYLGVPLNDTTNLRLEIADVGMKVLGDKLKGLQVGNEPDLYFRHGHRLDGYGPSNYDQEFGAVAAALEKDSSATDKQLLIGPSIAMGDWTPEMVWDVGFATNHPELKMLSVEKYPTDNCWPQYQVGTFHPPQQVFSDFLNHTSGQSIVQPYLNSTAYAQTLGKPFIMFETNTASCGGFPGVSNSFGAALWALDYGLQMAYSNFSGALLHVGGQNVYYNVNLFFMFFQQSILTARTSRSLLRLPTFPLSANGLSAPCIIQASLWLRSSVALEMHRFWIYSLTMRIFLRLLMEYMRTAHPQDLFYSTISPIPQVPRPTLLILTSAVGRPVSRMLSRRPLKSSKF